MVNGLCAVRRHLIHSLRYLRVRGEGNALMTTLSRFHPFIAPILSPVSCP